MAFLPFGLPYRLGMAILSAASLVAFLIPLYAYAMFSHRGGKMQEKVYNLVVRRLEIGGAQGQVLDIGSGNGVLAVKIAQSYPGVTVTGIDAWGQDWEYSQSVCEQNARLAGVQERVRFHKGDAARLEFADNTFDGAASNLTFHEVKSVPDKKLVLQEALRVIKPGGAFAFVDYFYAPNYYGDPAGLEVFLSGLGLARYEIRPLREMISLPALLNHPKIFGKVGLIYGKK